jgi:hypothetical protein
LFNNLSRLDQRASRAEIASLGSNLPADLSYTFICLSDITVNYSWFCIWFYKTSNFAKILFIHWLDSGVISRCHPYKIKIKNLSDSTLLFYCVVITVAPLVLGDEVFSVDSSEISPLVLGDEVFSVDSSEIT